MKSSPIYNIIYNPGRKSDCSFGARDQFTQEIRVGTSSNNSHVLGSIAVQRYVLEDGRVQFSLWVDGVLVKRGHLIDKEFHFDSTINV